MMVKKCKEEELQHHMKIQKWKDIECKKVAWTIKEHSKLKRNKLHSSEVFTIHNTAWQLLVRVQKGYLSVFLRVANAASLPEGWSIYAEFCLAVVNQVSRELSVTKETKRQFCANEDDDWGFSSFMPLSKLHTPKSGYILSDKCIVEVEFFVLRSEKTVIEPTSYPATPNNELVDFRGLGQIDKAYIPLLEEVCTWHPSLVQCQKKRTRRFTEWAFTALGRVLLFLKTNKAKEMTESACEQLQQLWDELETCKFDLTWLEPHVQFALGVKEYREKAKNVKKLKEELVALETEVKRSREMLANKEENIDKVRKELVKEEEGFEERNLDAEIGYGKP